MPIDILQELDKQGKLNTPEAREIALRVYKRGLPPHECYWNDKFYIAVRANLPAEYQKLAAHRSIVENGDWAHGGYFEAKTHHGFDMISLLRDAGVPENLLRTISPSRKIPDYQDLSYEIRNFIQEKFGALDAHEAWDLEMKLCREQ